MCLLWDLVSYDIWYILKIYRWNWWNRVQNRSSFPTSGVFPLAFKLQLRLLGFWILVALSQVLMWRILFRQRPCQVFLRRRVLASNMNCLNEFCSAHVDARQLTHCGPLDGDSKACHGPLSRLMPQLLVVSPDSKPLQLAKLRHLQAAKAASFRDCFRDQRPSGHQAPTKRPPSHHQAAKRLVLSMPNAWILPTGLDSWTNTQILCHLVRADRDHPPQACGQTVGTLWLPHQPHLQMEKVQ